MRRSILAAAVALGLASIAGLVLHLALPSAQTAPPTAARPAAGQLPIAQVMLYSSGVGYFQREGEVEGSARVDLSFPVQDINDLLKSMVLQDLDGGRISAVSYDSQAPIDRTLKSFAIDLTGNPSFGQVLNQARGEKVEVVLQQSGGTQPGTLTGAILGVERQKQAVAKEAVELELLNLWCAEGLRSVKLSDVQRVRFLNPVMDSEVKRALEVLALSHDTQKKAVSLSFSGDGKRRVQVGYVVENPIWKTSYRLVLPPLNPPVAREGKGRVGKPVLQGWAIVENTSDDDWNHVRMALISGRPIGFQMDLYQPLYVPRPIVEPELFASLRPPTYNGDLGRDRNLSNEQIGKEADAPTNYNVDRLHTRVGGMLARGGAGVPQAPPAAKPQPRDQAKGTKDDATLDLKLGVASAANATEMGDYFQYVIEHPVSLARQKSALLPIVNQDVEGTRVSIYNQAVQARHPLLGLKFKNTTGLHLMQGPITVFEGSAYAGDARILDLQPKEERLLSYAIDLGTEVEAVARDTPNRLIKVKITRGMLVSTTKVRETKVYTVKNRSEHERTLLVEHPYRPEFKLLAPEKPAERARDVYRFEVPVPAGKTARLEVVEEQDLLQRVQLSNNNDQTIQLFVSSSVSSPAVKDSLKQALELKGKVARTQRDLAQAQRQLNDIVQDQTRLRANLKEMPPTAAAYKRYLKKFDDQETEIEQLRDTIKQFQAAEHQQQKDLDAYLANLSAE